MAYVGSLCLFVTLQSAMAMVHKFETYSDPECQVLTKTDYVDKVSGTTDCYVYTNQDGSVAASPASSFTMTCSPGPTGYAVYESEDCTGSSGSEVDPWFAKTMCSNTHLHEIQQVMTVYEQYGTPGQTCAKAYLTQW
jgi:hypothetical protein